MVNPIIGKSINLEIISNCYEENIRKIEEVIIEKEIGKGRNGVVYKV